eukprot:gene6518-3156_t
MLMTWLLTTPDNTFSCQIQNDVARLQQELQASNRRAGETSRLRQQLSVPRPSISGKTSQPSSWPQNQTTHLADPGPSGPPLVSPPHEAPLCQPPRDAAFQEHSTFSFSQHGRMQDAKKPARAAIRQPTQLTQGKVSLIEARLDPQAVRFYDNGSSEVHGGLSPQEWAPPEPHCADSPSPNANALIHELNGLRDAGADLPSRDGHGSTGVLVPISPRGRLAKNTKQNRGGATSNLSPRQPFWSGVRGDPSASNPNPNSSHGAGRGGRGKGQQGGRQSRHQSPANSRRQQAQQLTASLLAAGIPTIKQSLVDGRELRCKR